jgi:hypothetical protein
MEVKERILLIAKYSNSLVDFRNNMERLGVNDALGRQMYYLSVMLSEVEESDYVLPDPDVEHLTWVFHQTARSMLNQIIKDPDAGVVKAYSYFQHMRVELLNGAGQ